MLVHYFFDSRISQLVAVLFLVVAAAQAQTYSCGDPSKGHCYGKTTWTQASEYFGASTDITQVSMSCPSGCGGFVDDEIWLIDTSSRYCMTTAWNMCWIEAGTIVKEGEPNTFFWAECRPGTGNTFNYHYLGPADPVGTVDHYKIIKDGRSSPNDYLIFVYNDSQSTLYSGTSSGWIMTGSGFSFLPQMIANRIDIGQELAGSPSTAVASAGTANFTRSRWAIQALDSRYVFRYNAYTTAGDVNSARPPTASWSINPGAPGAPEGGQFTTSCCS
jgi:hypothetical protein